MSNPKLALFLDAVSRLLPVLGPALRIPPQYLPVIQDGIALAESSNLKGTDKLTQAVQHVTANQPKKSDGTGTVGFAVGPLTDSIGAIVDAANVASTIGSTLNKF